MPEKLKPCPFCGKDDAIFITQTHRGISLFYCECIRCHYITHICSTRKGARRSWNRRIIHKRPKDI